MVPMCEYKEQKRRGLSFFHFISTTYNIFLDIYFTTFSFYLQITFCNTFVEQNPRINLHSLENKLYTELFF